MNTRQVFWLIGLLGGALVANACGPGDATDVCLNPKSDGYNDVICKESRVWLAEDLYKTGECLDPKSRAYPYPICDEVRARVAAEAAKDAGADGDAGESDADADPDAGSANNCVPNPPNDFAAPQPVWFGAKNEAPKECPREVGAFGDRGFLELIDPGLDGCPQCACGPIEGVCSKQVTSILFRGAVCNVAESTTIDFSPPENWDGSCSNNHAIAPNAECPPGSGNPCVQSSYASALPDPVEGCKPIEIPVPKLITETPSWGNAFLSCSPTYSNPPPDPDGEIDNSTTCFNQPEGWHSCVRHLARGIFACKLESKYTVQKIAYPENAIIDHRSCSACECKASGGTCQASFRLYEDDACTTLQTQSFVFSGHPTCADVGIGMGVGSTEIVDPVYFPGSCEPMGGVPIGAVEIDTTDAVTWCCIPD